MMAAGHCMVSISGALLPRRQCWILFILCVRKQIVQRLFLEF